MAAQAFYSTACKYPLEEAEKSCEGIQEKPSWHSQVATTSICQLGSSRALTSAAILTSIGLGRARDILGSTREAFRDDPWIRTKALIKRCSVTVRSSRILMSLAPCLQESRILKKKMEAGFDDIQNRGLHRQQYGSVAGVSGSAYEAEVTPF